MSISYADYLKVEELLSLQKRQSSPLAEDELLFIIVHQSYELWFKQLLYEVELLSQGLRESRGWYVTKKLKRVLRILKLAVAQTDILETMTPRGFADFRGFLETASGLQSYQFKEIEIVFGWRHPSAVYKVFKPQSLALQQINARLQEPCLWDYFYGFLQTYDQKLPSLCVNSSPSGLRYLPSEKLQESIFRLMQDYPEIDIIVELLVDLDEGLQEWRYRHLKMVERTIGNKVGTGGTNGIDYLKNSLHRQLFPDLWAVRNLF